MFENKDSENKIVNKVALFEEMIAGKSFTFFDVEDFEKIIEYYVGVDFKNKANTALDYAMKQFPNDLSLTLIKVEFLNSKQKFKESFNCLEKISQFYPNSIEIILNLGKIHSITDQFNDAVNCFDHAYGLILGDSNFNELLSDIAYEFLQIGQNQKAIEVMKKILDLDPANESTMMELGVAYHETGQFKEAINYFNGIINDRPYSHLAWFNLGTIYNVNEEWNDALFAFDMCLVISEKFTAAHYGKANSFIQLKEYQNAIDVFNESFLFDHPHSYAYCSIGECYEKMGEYSKALLFYEKSLEIDDSQSDAWIGLGVVRDLKDQPEDAKRFIEKALKIDPENAEYWYIFAELLSKLDSKEEAEIAFKKVVELDPGNVDAWIDYSNFLFDNSSKSKAIEEVERAIKKNTGEPDLQLRLVAMQISAGNISDARNRLVQLQDTEKSSCEKLFEIYPEAKDIPEINNIINHYKDKNTL
jgi:tetratricopeptide (TPR) repeat protein